MPQAPVTGLHPWPSLGAVLQLSPHPHPLLCGVSPEPPEPDGMLLPVFLLDEVPPE